MDPLNLEVIQAAVKTVNENTIPLLEAAFARQLAQATKDMTDVVDRANVQIANQVQGALIGFQAVADKAAKDHAPESGALVLRPRWRGGGGRAVLRGREGAAGDDGGVMKQESTMVNTTDIPNLPSFDEQIRDLTGRQGDLQREIDNLSEDYRSEIDILVSSKQTIQAKIDRCRSEEDARKEGGWRCPLCGNRYSFADGVRYLTASKVCPCPEMPAGIRTVRERRNQQVLQCNVGYQTGVDHTVGAQKHHGETPTLWAKVRLKDGGEWESGGILSVHPAADVNLQFDKPNNLGVVFFLDKIESVTLRVEREPTSLGAGGYDCRSDIDGEDTLGSR